MIRLSLAAAAAALVLAACASDPGPRAEPGVVTLPSGYELAMATAGELRAAGNVPAAIQRLMQLAGDPDLTPDQKASVLYELATLSKGPGGYDLAGALDYFDEIVATYPGTEWARRAEAELPSTRSALDAQNAIATSLASTPTEKFYALMQLGRHLDAIDLMNAYSIEPDNEVKLAMFQIGYLCDESGLTGRSYTVTDRDGVVRTLRFCDYGK